MTLKPEMPGGLTAAERLQRANAAKAVTSQAAMSGGSPAVQPPAADPAPVAAVATPGARPWEKIVVSEKASLKRLPLIMPTSLRAKLQYLAEKEPGESMSSISIAGIEAECLRLEKAAGVMPEVEAKKVRSRVEDKHAKPDDDETRMVVLVPAALQERMDLLIKDFKLAKDRTKIALPGIEDECNRRLKARGEL
ncbi:hypothetical protein FSY45_24675 [Comamonas sp. Z1]|uniref:hypothetical protein n=1 Tax=Comamonas TaxID=283 RepID=UPI0011E6F959|nr:MULTISPECIES: hypothetical protein [Comamonas]TYK70263.1 hypothetical protein FSY45_24675 [Comamonas sp. Z1]UBQ44628.1 hypothetical protein LCH15_26105 [Comamonas thiooxydans]